MFLNFRKIVGALSIIAGVLSVLFFFMFHGWEVPVVTVTAVVASVGFLAYLITAYLALADMVNGSKNTLGWWSLAIYVVWHIIVFLLNYDLDYQSDILLVLDPGLIFVILFEDLTSFIWKPEG